MNNNIMNLIYNFQHLNNQLSLTITHVKLLAQYNKLKKTLISGDQPKITAQTSVARPPEPKRQRTETTLEQQLPE